MRTNPPGWVDPLLSTEVQDDPVSTWVPQPGLPPQPGLIGGRQIEVEAGGPEAGYTLVEIRAFEVDGWALAAGQCIH